MTQTTLTSATAWSPDQIATPVGDAIPEALINQITTRAGVVEGDEPAIRVPVVHDDEGAFIVPEGEIIPEVEPELAEALVLTTKVAKIIPVSREQIVQDGTNRMLSAAAKRSITEKSNDVLLNTATGGNAPAGLLNQGIIDAGKLDTNLDALIDAMATIEANGSNPSHIVLAPDTWATLRKLKTGDNSQQTLLGAGTSDAARLLLDTPVLVNKAIPAGTGLIVDNQDIVSAYGEVMTNMSEHVYFASDRVAVRVMFRFGATIVHPDRHATFSIATQDAGDDEAGDGEASA